MRQGFNALNALCRDQSAKVLCGLKVLYLSKAFSSWRRMSAMVLAVRLLQ